ncbi:hypothetical protein C7405_101612 [Paraburkholderia caballeronis]|uniref:hypothetical protein n=1 Tax=Paraburkholderia caballeronis TaxID=416943 RepID=UPI0010670397|nr:hypothetical protein [Paraburkholderia caballeronis]TDV39493.1 hypothetical protein C7405_101612 [Paraburkholderia caballeronis]
MNYFQSYAGQPSAFSMPTVAAGAGGAFSTGSAGASSANLSGGVSDLLRLINEGVAAPILDGLRQAATNLTDSFGGASSGATMRSAPQRARGGWRQGDPATRRYASYQDCGCDCDCDCGRDTCHCQCCIVDADLIVYARVGERRIVPLSIDNPRRRERKVELKLGEWSSRGGSPAPTVQAELLPKEGAIELPPCGSKQALLIVSSSLAANQREPVDVDDCRVFYADLTVLGCEIRPIRIALALLPLDCGPFQIHCGCCCC